jgi:nitrous oxidase accessory protein NosD
MVCFSPIRLLLSACILPLILLLAFPLALFAQSTVGTGSIVGLVTDPSGTVVASAKVTVTNLSTGRRVNLTTNGAGAFNSGALVPGNYQGTALTVNTEQPTVQGCSMPSKSRICQSMDATFSTWRSSNLAFRSRTIKISSPRKLVFSWISFGGCFGRTVRV